MVSGSLARAGATAECTHSNGVGDPQSPITRAHANVDVEHKSTRSYCRVRPRCESTHARKAHRAAPLCALRRAAAAVCVSADTSPPPTLSTHMHKTPNHRPTTHAKGAATARRCSPSGSAPRRRSRASSTSPRSTPTRTARWRSSTASGERAAAFWLAAQLCYERLWG